MFDICSQYYSAHVQHATWQTQLEEHLAYLLPGFTIHTTTLAELLVQLFALCRLLCCVSVRMPETHGHAQVNDPQHSHPSDIQAMTD